MRPIVITLLLLIPVIACAEVVTDWDRGMITVKATGYALATTAEAEELAEDAARTEAYGLLLHSVKGVHVTTDITIDQFGKEHKAVETRMEGLINNVVSQSSPRFSRTGDKVSATIEMKMCLHNAGSAECRNRESILSMVNAVAPDAGMPVSTEKLQETDSCESVQPSDFGGRTGERIASVAILAENFIPALKPDIPIVKYTDGKGGFCTLFSQGKMDADAIDRFRTGARFKNIHLSIDEARPRMDREAEIIKAVSVGKNNVIIIDPADGRYLFFVDQRLNREISRKGKVAVVTSAAISESSK